MAPHPKYPVGLKRAGGLLGTSPGVTVSYGGHGEGPTRMEGWPLWVPEAGSPRSACRRAGSFWRLWGDLSHHRWGLLGLWLADASLRSLPPRTALAPRRPLLQASEVLALGLQCVRGPAGDPAEPLMPEKQPRTQGLALQGLWSGGGHHRVLPHPTLGPDGDSGCRGSRLEAEAGESRPAPRPVLGHARVMGTRG